MKSSILILSHNQRNMSIEYSWYQQLDQFSGNFTNSNGNEYNVSFREDRFYETYPMDICNFLVPNSDSTSHIPITLIFDIKNQKTWKRKLAQRKELLDKVATKAKGKTKGKGKNQKKVTKREIIKLSHLYMFFYK